MNKHRFFFLSLMFLLTYFPCVILAAEKSGLQADRELKEILDMCAGYCEKASQVNLCFGCRERISERIFHHRPEAGRVLDYPGDKLFKKNEMNDWVYYYQFTLNNYKISEERHLLEENGQKMNQKDAPLRTRMYGKNILFFEPMVALSKESQSQFDYKIIKEEILSGEQAVVLEAIPKDNRGPSCLSGKIWISKADGGILKMEWEMICQGDFSGIAVTTEGLEVKPKITSTLEFGYQKNGIRFPSSYRVLEVYQEPVGKKRFLRSRTIVTFSDYYFF